MFILEMKLQQLYEGNNESDQTLAGQCPCV